MGNPQRLPFSAEHVGSLKRPESLQRVRERLLGPQPLDKNLGAHDNAELRAIEDEAINQTIKLQEEVGIEVITDGEFRRRTWWTDFILGFDGAVENTGTDSPIVVVDKSEAVLRHFLQYSIVEDAAEIVGILLLSGIKEVEMQGYIIHQRLLAQGIAVIDDRLGFVAPVFCHTKEILLEFIL